MPAGATAADKLKLMAKLSLARALGAVWLLPVADLYVRAKLNVIGELVCKGRRTGEGLGFTTLQRWLPPPQLGVLGARFGPCHQRLQVRIPQPFHCSKLGHQPSHTPLRCVLRRPAPVPAGETVQAEAAPGFPVPRPAVWHWPRHGRAWRLPAAQVR